MVRDINRAGNSEVAIIWGHMDKETRSSAADDKRSLHQQKHVNCMIDVDRGYSAAIVAVQCDCIASHVARAPHTPSVPMHATRPSPR